MTRNSYWVAMVNECHVDSPTNEAFAFEMAENGMHGGDRGEHLLPRRRHVRGSTSSASCRWSAPCARCSSWAACSSNLCDSLQFSVAGKGWSTDFDTLAEAPQYDEKKEEEE